MNLKKVLEAMAASAIPGRDEFFGQVQVHLNLSGKFRSPDLEIEIKGKDVRFYSSP